MLSIFDKKIQGKRVAIVGNLTPTEDLSEEIDNHDIVIRINHFYNYDSGLVGKKVDMLFVTPTETWKKMSPQERHEHVIREQKPDVFAVKHYTRIDNEIKNNHFRGCKIYKFEQDKLKNSQVYTTGTAALRILTNCADFTCDCYCFSFDEEWKNYIDNDAKHYARNMDNEEKYRREWIEMLNSKRFFNNTIHPVICVRKGSSLKDKNVRPYKDGKCLLQICIEKVKKVFGQVTVLADDEDYCEMAKSWGADVPYLDEKVDGNEDVTVRLRRWKDRCGIGGRIIQFQCTSPNIRIESIEKVKELSMTDDYRNVIISTVPFDEVKYSALMFYDEKNDRMVQALGHNYDLNYKCPQISRPRQELKQMYHYNGAFTSFAPSQLDKESLFDDATLIPCMVTKEESLDIDTLEHFNR